MLFFYLIFAQIPLKCLSNLVPLSNFPVPHLLSAAARRLKRRLRRRGVSQSPVGADSMYDVSGRDSDRRRRGRRKVAGGGGGGGGGGGRRRRERERKREKKEM
jgi:uncharacterized membrane protein YgcG